RAIRSARVRSDSTDAAPRSARPVRETPRARCRALRIGRLLPAARCKAGSDSRRGRTGGRRANPRLRPARRTAGGRRPSASARTPTPFETVTEDGALQGATPPFATTGHASHIRGTVPLNKTQEEHLAIVGLQL